MKTQVHKLWHIDVNSEVFFPQVFSFSPRDLLAALRSVTVTVTWNSCAME